MAVVERARVGGTMMAMAIAETPLPAGRRRLERPVGVGAVLALLLLVVQGWAPVLTGGGSGPSSSASPRSEPTLDPTVIEKATHGIVAVAGRPGALEVRGDGYRGGFDASGFTYLPDGASDAFGISLASVERGGDALALDLGPWSAAANVAERPVAAGINERVTARGGEIEWDVVLGAAPAGRGDLAVSARLDGVVGKPTRTQVDGDPMWRFDLAGGSQVDLDELVVLDATGAELHRALPAVTARASSWWCPRRCWPAPPTPSSSTPP